MSTANLTIKLNSNQDRDGKTYYVGKLKFDGSISFKDGVTFLLFISDEGDEQLQLAPMIQKS